MTSNNRLLAVWSLVLPTLALCASAACAAPQTPQLKVSAVDANTFHIVAYQRGMTAPPTSPFIVQTKDWKGARVQNHATASSVQSPAGNFILDSQGKWSLTGPNQIILSGILSGAADKMTFTLQHPAGERFYGAGNEKRDISGNLQHPSDTQVIDNGVTRVPFLWSTGGYSVLVANNQNGASWKDDANTLTWTMPAPYIDIYLSVAPTSYGLLDAYSRLTGPALIPPRWTFGFLMSKWGYKDNADIRDKWIQFRRRQIPVDAFIYDYEWFKNDWEFNEANFSPKDIEDMHKMGLHVGGIRKPRVNGPNLDFARQKGWILNSPIGADVRFDLPESAYWWWSKHVPLVQAGFDGWWNDEAEQSIDEFFQMSRVEYEGWRSLSPRRSWMINRGFAPGIQRLGAAAWTGDTHSSWDNLRNQKGILLNWSLAGMPFTSDDIGGFEGLPTTESELYTRWIQSSVFAPIMREHCTLFEVRWPWAFGPEAEAATKKAIELRYRLIPYLYTLAEETARTGAPIARPMLMEFPQDLKTAEMRDQWLLGSRLLAAPVLNKGGGREVYLPAGNWYDFNTGAPLQGNQTLQVTAPLDTIPLYTRAGTILPLGPIMQSTALGITDPLEVRVYPGANAQFSLYEDDGDNYEYQKGAFTRIPLSWDDKNATLSLGKREGSYPGMLATRHLSVVLPGQPARALTYTGAPLKLKF